MTTVSVAIPCYKSAKTITPVVNEIRDTIKTRPDFDYQIILVNDYPDDDTFDVIAGLCAQDPKIVGVNLSRNFGQTTAKIAAMAMGDDPREIFARREDGHVANASRMMLSEVSGTVKSITDGVTRDDSVYDLSVIVKEGDHVEKFTNAKDRLGQIIVRGQSREECFRRIDEIQKQFIIEIQQ